MKKLFLFASTIFIDIGYLYKFQSGFRPGDSTVNQLSYIVHQIYLALDNYKEVRIVFWYISKAFDRVWHAGLICKLELLGVCNPSLRSADNFTQLQCRIVRYQESVFPSSIKIWINRSLDLRNSISLLTFKAKLQFYIFPYTYNKLFHYSISRQAFILHTRLRLGYCALNDYLFKINL